jgi:hypothetical protein
LIRERQQRLSPGETDPVAFGQATEPVLVEIDDPLRLGEPAVAWLEQGIAERFSVMARMKGDAMGLKGMGGQSLEPVLRHIVGETGVSDLRRCSDAGKAPTGELDQLPIGGCTQADIGFPLKSAISFSVGPCWRRKVCANAPAASRAW